MMSRPEFEAFWLPKVNDVARRHGQAMVTTSDLDGLWHNYLLQQDDGLQARADAVVQGERVQ